jgi:PAS domain S-box-containing protein
MTARLRDLMEAAPVVAFIKDPAGHYLYANPYLLAIFGERMGSDWYGKTDADIWPPDVAALLRSNDQTVLGEGGLQVFSQVMPMSAGAHRILMLKFPVPSSGPQIDLGGIGVDLTQLSKAEAERDQLAIAIEQAAESVMIVDLEARITYVNPAFERVTGYTREEAIGQNPRFLSSGHQSRSFYEAMWAALTSGVPWVADFVNRRKDGSLFTEESVITPIRDPSGAITSYVAVKRDVTRERALVQRSSQFAQKRALIADTIRSLSARDTPEGTAQAICRQVITLAGVTAAQFFLFELDGRAMPIGFVVTGQPDPPLRRLPFQRSRHLRERAAEGPWIEPWVNRPWHPYNQLLTGLGVHAVAYAPVRHDQRLIGVLVIDAHEAVDEAALTETLPALVEFADLAGALIGRDVVERTEVRRGRDHIRAIVAERSFHPVFQPIVDLERDAVVGYEALTRFTDGVAPDERFAEAAAVELGHELELATLGAALTAAKALPPEAWLNLNVSPGLIIAGEPLRTLIAGSRRPLVLEVTEHTAIADYPLLLVAMARLGPNVEFAVDDAGAGFASLRHILELRPAFVKLDRWLIADLESDEARQAMIVGLHYFARATGCRLIAEGIETEAELAILRALNIRLGQGYLLGRPEPVKGTGGRAP